MNKQNKDNLNHGISKVNDLKKQSMSKVISNDQSNFQLNLTDIHKGTERKCNKSYRDNLSYTPHQNKFYGYCQFPNQKLNSIKLNESRMTTLQQYSPISVDKSQTKSQPQKTSIMNGKQLKVNNCEILFQDNPYHLSGNIQDVIQNYEKNTIQSFVFRKGSSPVNRMKSQPNKNQSRFVCKYINHRKIHSPPIKIINKFIINLDQQQLQNKQSNQTENIKITLGTDRERLNIQNDVHDEKYSRSLSKSLYQTLDLSLQNDKQQPIVMKSVNEDTILCDQNNLKVSEIQQSFIFKSNFSINSKQLITTKNQLENSSKIEKELELYPEFKQAKEQKKNKQYKTLLYTESELSQKEKDLNTNYLL